MSAGYTLVNRFDRRTIDPSREKAESRQGLQALSLTDLVVVFNYVIEWITDRRK
jgi:hypothetical protein